MEIYNACHRSADYWAKPDIYNPDHFLEEGKLINDKEGFLHYGTGPRVCPGAELADMQLFLMQMLSGPWFEKTSNIVIK